MRRIDDHVFGSVDRSRPARVTGEEGFALVSVIWISVLLATVAFIFTASVRSYTRSAEADLAVSEAEAMADAAANVGLLDLMAASRADASGRFAPDGSAVSCALPGDAIATIRVRDEAGKIDLNVAGDGLLQALFVGLGLAPEQVSRRLEALADFRDPDSDRRLNGAEADDYAAEGRAGGPKNAAFEAVEELGSIIGFDAAFVERLRPHVTVYSGQSGIDPKAVSQELAALLAQGLRDGGSDPAAISENVSGLPGAFVNASAKRMFSIEAEIVTRRGARFVREAIVSLVNETRRPALADGASTPVRAPYRIWRWRRGSAFTSTTQPGAAIDPC